MDSEPLRTLFGLCTAPTTMNSVRNGGLQELTSNGQMTVYIDDVCIFRDTTEVNWGLDD